MSFNVRSIVILLCVICVATSTGAQQKVYKLTGTVSNADFNYEALNSIDTSKSRRTVFNPVKGKYVVYTFIATYQGLSHRDDKQHDFHDILIIKAEKNDRIMDAFQYTLEWSEMPLSYDLFRSNSKDMVLINGLSIEKLDLHRVEYSAEGDKKSNEKGILKLQ